jgi:hypothetical protein
LAVGPVTRHSGERTLGDVTAIAWSLVGLLGVALGILATALLSGLARIDARLDALGGELRGDLHDLRETVHSLDLRLTSAGG